MAYGKVEETFWHDAVVRSLSEEGRHLYLYLFTGPHRNRIGCYVLDPWYAAADLQWTPEKVRTAMEELENADRIEWDRDARLVLIKRWLRYNTMENKSVVRAAMSDLAALPSSQLLSRLLDAIVENSRPHYHDIITSLRHRVGHGVPHDAAHHDRDSGRLARVSPEPEPEPEQEPEQEPLSTSGGGESVLPRAHETGTRQPSPPPPTELLELLPDHPAAAQIIAAMDHPGELVNAIGGIRMRLLYDGDGTMGDPSVKGLPLSKRRELVAAAAVEMQAVGRSEWTLPQAVAFIGRIRGRQKPPGAPDNLGDESQRDANRRAEAVARGTQRKLEQMEGDEDKALAEQEELLAWIGQQPKELRDEMEKQARERYSNLPKLPESVAHGVLLGVAQEFRERLLEERRASA